MTPSSLRPTPARRRPDFDGSLLLGDIAAVLWLWLASAAFLPADLHPLPTALWLPVAAGLGAWALGLHRRLAERGLAPCLGQTLLLAVGIAAAVLLALLLMPGSFQPGFALWFGAAAAVLLLAFRLAF